MRTYINSRKLLASIFALVAIFYAFDLSAQKFAVKAYGNIGFGDALNLKSSLPEAGMKSSANEFGLDFGYRFWQKPKHNLEVNIGLGYRNLSTDLSLSKLDYSYAAPTSADMDGESYIRYYEMNGLQQKNDVSQVTIHIYLSYGFQCTNRLGIHADLGAKLGVKTGSKISNVSGESYSYGVYPQYDNLMIDAEYMNDFGRKEISSYTTVNPDALSISASMFVGVGAEFKIYGPLSADLSLRYERGFNNIFKPQMEVANGFTASNAPLTYTVADGSSVRPLTDYLTTSKLSQLTFGISLICRF